MFKGPETLSPKQDTPNAIELDLIPLDDNRETSVPNQAEEQTVSDPISFKDFGKQTDMGPVPTAEEAEAMDKERRIKKGERLVEEAQERDVARVKKEKGEKLTDKEEFLLADEIRLKKNNGEQVTEPKPAEAKGKTLEKKLRDVEERITLAVNSKNVEELARLRKERGALQAEGIRASRETAVTGVQKEIVDKREKNIEAGTTPVQPIVQSESVEKKTEDVKVVQPAKPEGTPTVAEKALEEMAKAASGRRSKEEIISALEAMGEPIPYAELVEKEPVSESPKVETPKVPEKPVVVEKGIEEKRAEAARILSNPEVMTASIPAQRELAFSDLTMDGSGNHENLKQKRREAAEKNLVDKGMRIIKGEDVEKYRQEIIAAEEKKILDEQRAYAMQKCWERLSDKQKGKLGARQDSPQFAEYLKQKREKLGISEEVFNILVSRGHVAESTITRGWSRILIGPAIEIPLLPTEAGVKQKPIPFESKKEFIKWVESLPIEVNRKEAQRRADDAIFKGQKILLDEKLRCEKEIIQKAVEQYNMEIEKKQKEIVSVNVETDNTEIEKAVVRPPEIISKESTPEQLKEMEKMQKRIERVIKENQEARKMIAGLLKKQRRGEILKAKEVRYLNNFRQKAA